MRLSMVQHALVKKTREHLYPVCMILVKNGHALVSKQKIIFTYVYIGEIMQRKANIYTSSKR